jgi:hypothetical protein
MLTVVALAAENMMEYLEPQFNICRKSSFDDPEDYARFQAADESLRLLRSSLDTLKVKPDAPTA